MPAVRRCPSLGLDDDKDTCMTFATESHHCYRLSRHKAVPLDHQYQYCLSENHIRCPVFLRGDRLFPKAARTQAMATPVSRSPQSITIPKTALKWIIALSAILVLAFVSWWVFAKTDIFTRPDPPVQAFGDLPPGVTPTITRTVMEFSPNLTMIYELTAVATATGNPQLSQVIPVTGQEATVATQTFTPTAIACSLPEGWVVYTVKLWDTLYWLSLSVSTTVDELIEVNCLTSQTLIVGQQLFLPYFPPKASFTPMKSPTSTEFPPTSTYTRTYTATATRTPTVVFTFTNTPVPPTATSVPPTLTLTYTFTPVPPTETPIPPTETPVTPETPEE